MKLAVCSQASGQYGSCTSHAWLQIYKWRKQLEATPVTKTTHADDFIISKLTPKDVMQMRWCAILSAYDSIIYMI